MLYILYKSILYWAWIRLKFLILKPYQIYKQVDIILLIKLIKSIYKNNIDALEMQNIKLLIFPIFKSIKAAKNNFQK